MAEKHLSLILCEFKRTEQSKSELGILINEGELILDADGKPVSAPVWDYWRREYKFCVEICMSI